MVYEVWTDGSCLDNNPLGGPGGFAWVASLGDLKTEYSKGYFKTTNNRMEIMAVIDALSQVQERSVIKIHTDSQYTIDGATKWVWGWIKNGWRRQPQPGVFEDVKNADLFKRLHALTRFHKVEFIKVKAHSGVPDNERCDVLAKAAAGQPSEVDEGFIPTVKTDKPKSSWSYHKRR